ncbi:MAG: hypothetical protein HYU97_00480 [Deltaproteobacteria bacterium]|nr:hypothetical protein [Deltaproteobacteria bacterium]
MVRPTLDIVTIGQCNPNIETASDACTLNGSMDAIFEAPFGDMGVEHLVLKDLNLLLSFEVGFGEDLPEGYLLGTNGDFVGELDETVRRYEAALGYKAHGADFKLGITDPARYIFPSNTTRDENRLFLNGGIWRPRTFQLPASLVMPGFGGSYDADFLIVAAGFGWDAFGSQDVMSFARLGVPWARGSHWEGAIHFVVVNTHGSTLDEENQVNVPHGGTTVGGFIEQQLGEHMRFGLQLGYIFDEANKDSFGLSPQLLGVFGENVFGFAYAYDQGDTLIPNAETGEGEEGHVQAVEFFYRRDVQVGEEVKLGLTAGLQTLFQPNTDVAWVPGARIFALW